MNKQRGFTLIELLVVIAILGVIAVVVVLNIGRFIGLGAVEAANVEMHQVQTAIVTYLADDATVTSFNATIGPTSNYPAEAPATEGVHQYITNPGTLQADYVIVDGTIADATPTENSRWRDLWFCEGSWQEEECAG